MDTRLTDHLGGRPSLQPIIEREFDVRNADIVYRLQWYPEDGDPAPSGERKELNFSFAQPGTNGLTVESLLAVVIDQLKRGPNPSRDKSVAITHIETALLWLKK